MTHTISPAAARAPTAGASPNVDIGIVTIRDDEFRAVLAAFPDKVGTLQGASRAYTLRDADAGGGERYRIAVLRLIEQGQGEAQDAARDLIDELGPRLVLVVGIAGGRPSDDVKLGDVVVSTRIHDFIVEARKAGEVPTYAVTGGPVDKALAALVANLAAREDELGDWTADLPKPPPVSWTDDGQLYGPPDWQRELRDTLEHHHGLQASPRAPAYATGPIASSDRLVSDPELLIPWLQTARNLLAIEMESGGVYRAARERCPMLAIRGISGIVGLKRADAWTKYACASAAAFTRAFLRTRPVEPGAARDDVEPPRTASHAGPLQARHRRADSSPTQETGMTREELLSRLSKLLSSQFEQVLYLARIPHEHLPAGTAAQASRAVELMRYVEQQNQLEQLARIVQQVVTGGGPASSDPPRTISPSPAQPPTPMPRSPMTANTILFMAANPAGTDARALAEQARAIQAELERAGHRDRFAFETRWAAQPLDLLREMVKLKPTVVHFCGGRLIDNPGGAPATGVYFQGPDGRTQMVSGEALAQAFDSVGSVKLVVLDACYSEHHADAIAAHIDCVVGMAGGTVDQAATSFSIGLYGGIGEGESVAAAFKQGCAAIGMTGAGDPGQPQLCVRHGVDARRLVLADPR